MKDARCAFWVLAGASLAALAACERAEAGAWPLEPGSGQAIVATTADWAERAYDSEGEPTFDSEFRKIEGSVFVEYGLTRSITMVGRVAYQDVDVGNDATRAFSASELGARAHLFSWRGGVVSAQALAVLPGEGENVVNERLGVGESGVEGRALAGYGWGDERSGAFIEAQAGYRWRAGEDVDEARLDATAGMRIDPRWMVMAQSFSAWGVDGVGPLDNYQAHRAQASVVHRVNDRWSLQAGVLRSYAGRDVVEENAVFLALWSRF